MRITTQLFQDFAGLDVERWQILVGREVRHKIFGDGTVCLIEARKPPCLQIRFKEAAGGKTERVFSSEIFGKLFEDMEVSYALHENILKTIRDTEIFKAKVRQAGRENIPAQQPLPGTAARKPPARKPVTAGVTPNRKASGPQKKIEKKADPEGKVECPFCVASYTQKDLVEHIYLIHPKRYPYWREQHDPSGKFSPPPKSSKKLGHAGKPGDQSAGEVISPHHRTRPEPVEKPGVTIVNGKPQGLQEAEQAAPAPKFRTGQQVIVVKDPKKRGVILGTPYLAAGEFQYEVFFSADLAQTYRESDLDYPQAAIQWGKLNEMLRNLALVKMSQPLNDNLYALYGSRTQFEVYQFKPALKFLGNPDGRLLIADEVGLGKTIEAGIIYLELQARLALNRVLVVCPSSLRYKWQDEMKLRFDEEFSVLDLQGMRRFIEQYKNYGEGARLRGIISLEGIRRAEIAEAIEGERLQLDLVILDEAHHCRNTGTLSNKVATLLSDNADAMLMLTATPLQMGNQDLFNLLRILSPGEFDDFEVFQDRLEPNQYINRAAGMLAAGEHHLALQALKLVERTRERKRFTGNPYYTEVTRLLEKPSLVKSELITAQRRLIELNTLAYIFTRTRKREIAEKVPTRAAFILTVKFSPAEEQFYQQMVADVRRQFALEHGSYASGWASIMRERQTASCISAVRKRYGGSLQPGPNSEEEAFFDPSIVGELETETLVWGKSKPVRISFPRLIEPERDSKFDLFWQALSKILEEDSTSKVIVFSFFRDTIEYLYDRLLRLGVDTLRLHGGFKVPDRQTIIDQFRSSSRVRVLISSDVGAEGLDFQFCNTLFNYDLPWNPMKVEQRIGRIDRFGQESERIRIYNLVIENSVESRILMRLYERIGIFKQAIGDIEAILGDEIRELSRKVYMAALTPEEERRLADQAAASILRRQQELEEFEEKRLQFMGQEAIFSTLLAQTIESGSYVSEHEVHALVSTYLSSLFPERRILESNGDGTFALNVTENFSVKISDFVHKQRRADWNAQEFLRNLSPGKLLPVTFSSQLAYQRKLLHFITLRHPLTQAAIEYWKDQVDASLLLARLGLHADDLRPGNYYVFVFVLESVGAEKSTRLVSVALVPGENDVYTGLSNSFLHLVQTSHFEPPLPYPVLDLDQIEAAHAAAREHMALRRDAIEAEIQHSNDALVNARLTALEQSFKAKQRRVREALDSATDVRIRNMRRGQLNNIEARHRVRKQEIEAQREVSVSFRLALKAYVTVRR